MIDEDMHRKKSKEILKSLEGLTINDGVMITGYTLSYLIEYCADPTTTLKQVTATMIDFRKRKLAAEIETIKAANDE